MPQQQATPPPRPPSRPKLSESKIRKKQEKEGTLSSFERHRSGNFCAPPPLSLSLLCVNPSSPPLSPFHIIKASNGVGETEKDEWKRKKEGGFSPHTE